MQVAIPVEPHQLAAGANIVKVNIILVLADSIKLLARIFIRQHGVAAYYPDGMHAVPTHCVCSNAPGPVCRGHKIAVKAKAGVSTLITPEIEITRSVPKEIVIVSRSVAEPKLDFVIIW